MRVDPLHAILPGLFAALGLAAVTHCGGSTSSPDAGPADATSTTGDATPDARDDALDAPGDSAAVDASEDVTLTVCPAAAPQLGSACSLPEQECEYGSSWWLGCNLIVRCAQGVWQKAPAEQACEQQDAGGACPATWDEASDLDAGIGLCPAPGCQYAEGYCECLLACGGGGAIPRPQLAGHWYCAAATPQCPSPRPDLGTSCGDSDASCQYGTPCGCGEQLFCIDGVWQGFSLPPCP
jgi:hypothetical protein